MGALIGSFGMSNVLNEAKKQQVLALGKLGWPLRRIEQATGVRRETAGAYLKAAGIAVRPPAGWGRRAPAKPANEVTTDPAEAKAAGEGTDNPGERSEEHTSELQSRLHLVCRLLLEKKNINKRHSG